jgi:hypothetical protein
MLVVVVVADIIHLVHMVLVAQAEVVLEVRRLLMDLMEQQTLEVVEVELDLHLPL